MTCTAFQTLVKVLPRAQKALQVDCNREVDRDPLDISDDSSIHRHQLWTNPAFGWYAVELMCDANMSFPIFPEGKINWLYRACFWKNSPQQYENHRSILPLIHAWHLHSDLSNRGAKAILNAALIAKDSTIEMVANALNHPLEVVEAYEALFFNVVDRRHDIMYLRNVAYPNTRLEEELENYLVETPLDVLLLRIGYNRGFKEVLYAAGLQENPEANLTAAEATERFQHEMLVTGCKLATAGFLNYEKQHPVIKATLEFIKASKSSKQASGGTGGGSGNEPGLGEVLKAQFAAAPLEAPGKAQGPKTVPATA